MTFVYIRTALTNLLSQAFNIEVEDPENEEALLESIIKANKNLKESTSNKDYEMMGKDIKQLQSLIDKLEQLQSQNTKDKENNNNTNTTINL